MENTGNPTDDDRTMYIRFESGDETGLRETLRAFDRGEIPDPHFEVIFDDPDDLHRITRPNNLKLLRTIVQHKPTSIRETARLVDRDVHQVHTNLEELESLHLIHFEQDGQSKRPTVWYDSLEVDLPLHAPDVTRDEANA